MNVFAALLLALVPAADREPAVDALSMPAELRPANIASQGAGCCTFRSAEYAARWQNIPALYGFPEWLRDNNIPGGGIPSKQAEMVRRISAARGLPTPRFVQYEGRDPAVIEMALKTGRLPCVTWGGNHMLCCVHLDKSEAAVFDNNKPDQIRWMSRQAFLEGWTAGGGGWAFVLLAPAPPPPPSGARTLPQLIKDCPCSPLCVCGCRQGKPCRCNDPAPEPAPAPSAEPAFGMDWSYRGVERCEIDGREAPWREVADCFGDPLADDSTLLHLTVIGPKEQRLEALAAIGDMASRYRLQEYEPGDWALAFGHQPTARVYLQATDGRVLLRADDITDLRGRLRRADPNYKPEADPQGKLTDLLPDLSQFKPYLPWAAGALIVLLIFRSRGDPPQPPPTDTEALIRKILKERKNERPAGKDPAG